MSLLFFIIVGSVLTSTSLISSASKSGFLNGAFTRSLAGGSTAIVSSNFLVGYTNLESFISASFNGSLGFSGYVFIGGLAALLLTWVSNLYNYQVLVK